MATVIADLLKAEERDATLDAVSEIWRKEVGNVPDVISITYKQPVIGPAGLPIDIRIQGGDLGRLKQASLKLMGWLNTYNDVIDLHDDLRPGKPELVVRMREGALVLGLTARTIARQLRAAFYGTTADEIQVGSESYEIDVRLAAPDQNTVADLENFLLVSPEGREVPLSSVATLHRGRGVGAHQPGGLGAYREHPRRR